MKKTLSFILGTMLLAYAFFALLFVATAFLAFDASALKYLWIGHWEPVVRMAFLCLWLLIIMEAKQ